MMIAPAARGAAESGRPWRIEMQIGEPWLPVRGLLGDRVFATIRAEGRAMPAVQAIALARQQALLLH